MSLSETQQTALRVVPRLTAALSFLGSAFILFSQHRNRRRALVGRSLLLGMSVADLLSSTSYLMGDTAFPDSPHGSEATCKVQGMLCHLQVGAAIYSGFLAWYYCLFVRYHWREKRLAKLYVPAAHCIVGVYVVATGIMALKYIHPHWIRCYISGPNSNLLMWLLFYVPIWTSMLLGSIAMMLIYLTVRRTEENSAQHQFSASAEHASSSTASPSSRGFIATELPRTHRVAYQSLGYTVAFIANYVFPTTSRIYITIKGATPFAIRILAVSFVTSQGFWNWLVYYLLPFWYDWRFRPKQPSSAPDEMVQERESSDPVDGESQCPTSEDGSLP